MAQWIEKLLDDIEETLQDLVKHFSLFLWCVGWRYGCQRYNTISNICLRYKFRIYYNRGTCQISTAQR